MISHSSQNQSSLVPCFLFPKSLVGGPLALPWTRSFFYLPPRIPFSPKSARRIHLPLSVLRDWLPPLQDPFWEPPCSLLNLSSLQPFNINWGHLHRTFYCGSCLGHSHRTLHCWSTRAQVSLDSALCHHKDPWCRAQRTPTGSQAGF